MRFPCLPMLWGDRLVELRDRGKGEVKGRGVGLRGQLVVLDR